jgi:hypothetical protein
LEASIRTLTAIQAVGDSYGWNDEYAGAFPHHARAEAMVAGFPAAWQAEPDLLAARSSNLRLLAESAHKTGRADIARQANDDAIAINRRLLAASPDDPQRLRKLVVSLWYAAVVHRTNERDAAARASIDEAVALARRMVARDADDAGALQMLALTAEVKAQVLADAGDMAGNAAIGAELLAAHDRLVTLAGAVPGARRSRAASLRTQGHNRWNLRDTAGACRLWRDALATYDALAAAGALSKLDANNARPEVAGYVATLCTGPVGWRRLD